MVTLSNVPAESRPEVYFTVLGPVRLFRNGGELAVGPGQEQAVLAMLLARAGNPISVATMIDAIWSDAPPASAMNVIQRSVGRIRRLLEPGLPHRASGQWLLRSGNSYRLVLDENECDLLRFRALVRRAKETTHPLKATVLRTEALALWDGTCAAGVESSVEAATVFRAIDAERSQVAIQAAEVAAAFTGAVPSYDLLRVLRAAVAADPLNELLHAALIRCLTAAGHRAEALGLIQFLRQRLADELGIGPGPALRQAHLDVLRSDDLPMQVPATVRPAMVPAELTTFSGRTAEIEHIDASVADRPDAAIVVIHGMGGVGKTTLAVRWARGNAHRFPDGELFVDLRGFGPEGRPIPPAEAMVPLLNALGVRAAEVSPNADERFALYRSILDRKRVLLIVDNARDEEHIRPLLPPGRGSLTLVTSRSRLTGLVGAQGAVPVALGALPVPDARAILRRRLRVSLSEDDKAAVDEIVAQCGGLPLALSIVAARPLKDPSLTPRTVADEMRASASRLRVLDGRDAGVRATLRWSYEALSPPARRAVRLAAVHRGFEGSLHLTASVCGIPLEEAQRLTDELIGVRFLDEPSPGRYQAHDLIGLFSFEMCMEDETDASRRAARGRLLSCYLASLAAASATVGGEIGPLDPPEPGVTPLTFDDAATVRDWFAVERPQIVLTLDDLGKHPPGSWEADQFDTLAGALSRLEAVLAALPVR
ncbi:BTAD domain-containing putative transcriptional regulator [Cryptosporangium sp. NPDC051539]|uniref:AfsR/SARP family transcriptional regulator n=1 Tax=Cryptosporangium sp. NPDC051539 TaxID=3363962 RepID=UPI0037A01020